MTSKGSLKTCRSLKKLADFYIRCVKPVCLNSREAKTRDVHDMTNNPTTAHTVLTDLGKMEKNG